MKTKIILFWSNKGGVGKTFLAVNTAASLALLQKRVLLLELNFQSIHSIDKMLNLVARFGLTNLISQIETLDKPEIIKKAVTPHSSGLDYLPMVSSSTPQPEFTAAKIKKFFEIASNLYDYIIIDSRRALTEGLVSVMQNSNLVVVVDTPEDLTVNKFEWFLSMLNSTHIPKAMIKLVINRSPSRYAVDPLAIKEKLGLDVLGEIPSDGKTVGLALNSCKPCVVDSPRSPVSQAIINFAQQLENEALYPEISVEEHTQISGKIQEQDGSLRKFGITQAKEEDTFIFSQDDEEIFLKKKTHEKLVKEMNIVNLGPESFTDEKLMAELKEKAKGIIERLLSQEYSKLTKDDEIRARLTKEIISEAFGLGPLEEFLDDPDVSDIMVNGQKQTFIEKSGKLIKTNAKFSSEKQMRSIIDRIIAPLGRRIDESTPMVDARLQDGSRFNALIPPLSLTGPMMTIRKFGRERPTVDSLLNKYNSLNDNMRTFLEAAVRGRKNIIVSGGTGSGKTTLLNIISTFIPDKERIVTIEDAAELRINKSHWIRLESRPPNMEGKGQIHIRTLFMNSLHMRPDRIIVGECRGSEVIDMLQAMNTGHDGSMTTLHANSTKDVLVRMSSMILLAGVELPIRAIYEMISTALDLIVHINRFSDGTRKIVEITEVAGLNADHQLELRDIFKYEQHGMDERGKIVGEYVATGNIPKSYEEFKIIGIDIDKKIFDPPARKK
ncbi:MAG: Flp pilus assembly complex ATPase component TadA [Candidatus Omnitrophica bacterium]|nr:Flp pilus assembly complex ATPase component TadA [Candidatus Omnitrophota bacterium]